MVQFAGRGRRLSDCDPLETLVSAQRDPEQQLQDKEVLETLEAALGALPKPCRTVCFLPLAREMSTAELAEVLEISDECARSRLRSDAHLSRLHRRHVRW